MNFFSLRESEFVFYGIRIALRFAASLTSLTGTVATTPSQHLHPFPTMRLSCHSPKGNKQFELVCRARFYMNHVMSIYLSIRFYNSCRRLPETKHHSSLFLHWSSSKFLIVTAACTPSIHVFLGRPLFRLSSGIHSIINFGILSSGILLTWPYHCSLFFSMISMMSGFPFTPVISFVHFLFFPSLIFLLTSLAHPFL